jgi:hypothetical protein
VRIYAVFLRYRQFVTLDSLCLIDNSTDNDDSHKCLQFFSTLSSSITDWKSGNPSQYHKQAANSSIDKKKGTPRSFETDRSKGFHEPKEEVASLENVCNVKSGLVITTFR